jgi:hypothetical protein
MTLQIGVGTISKRGLDIINYCAMNGVTLEFQEVIVSAWATPDFTNITDPEYVFGTGLSASNGLVKEKFESTITATGAATVEGTITKGDESFGTASYILPLASQLPVNAVTSQIDVRFYGLFVNDPEGKKLTLGVGEGSYFSISDSVSGSGWSGTVIDVISDVIYVSNVVGTLGTGTVNGGTSSATCSAVGDSKILFYYGCLQYDDVTPSIEAISLIPGMNMPFRTEIRYSSGLPSNITFINTATAEIEIHNSEALAHESTLLMLDGSNNPSADVSWGNNKITNLTNGTGDKDAINLGQRETIDSISYDSTFNNADVHTNFNNFAYYITTLPKRINKTVTLTLGANATQYDGITGDIAEISGFHGSGELIIDLGTYDLNTGAGNLGMTPTDMVLIKNNTLPITIKNGNIIAQFNTTTTKAVIRIKNNSGKVSFESSLDIDNGINTDYIIGIYAENSRNVHATSINFSSDGWKGFVSDNSVITLGASISSVGITNGQQYAQYCLNGGKINVKETSHITTSNTGNFHFYIDEANGGGSYARKFKLIKVLNSDDNSNYTYGGIISWGSAGPTHLGYGIVVDLIGSCNLLVYVLSGSAPVAGNFIDNVITYASATDQIDTVVDKHAEVDVSVDIQ